MNNASLVVLLESDPTACRYFLSLSKDVRDRLNACEAPIANLAQLRAQADQWMGTN